VASRCTNKDRRSRDTRGAAVQKWAELSQARSARPRPHASMEQDGGCARSSESRRKGRQTHRSYPGKGAVVRVAAGIFTPYSGLCSTLTYPTTKPPLSQVLQAIVENDRYPLSPRIRTLRAILAKLRPKPAREPLPPPKVYAQQRATAARRRR
jgi:hypothetical protein